MGAVGRIEPAATPGSVQAAMRAAAEADARAANARQMVLNDRPRLASIEEQQAALAATQQALTDLANGYLAQLTASQADRAALHAVDSALQAKDVTLAGELAANATADSANRAADLENLAADLIDRANIAQLQLGLSAVPKISRGSAVNAQAVGALGGYRDVVVPLAPAMPDDGYVAVPSMTATGTLLGNVNLTGIVAQTADAVTVRVTNAGASTLAVGTVRVGVLAVR